MVNEERRTKLNNKNETWMLRSKYLAELPTQERYLCYAIFGKPENPVVKELKEDGNITDFEDIFDEEFTVPYECGAVITAMKNLGFSTDCIRNVVVEYIRIREEKTASSLHEVYKNCDIDD